MCKFLYIFCYVCFSELKNCTKARDLVVRCGEWDIKNENEVLLHQDRKVQSVEIHPAFTYNKLVYNDFAVLHLKQEFELGPHINPICLPEKVNQRSGQYSNNCVAMGYGTKTYRSRVFQQFLKQVRLPIVSNPQCQSKLVRNTKLGKINSWQLHESFMCAGGQEGVDACKGDGGGALACPSLRDSNRHVLAGITAWGVGCGQKDVPGVYASVTDGLCFIHWATRCHQGDKYKSWYDYTSQCRNWFNEELAKPSNAKYRSKFNQMKSRCS